MATVYRRRTIVEQAEVPDDEDLLDTAAAIAMAKREGFQQVRDEVTYSVRLVRDGQEVVSQMTGRPEVEPKRKGKRSGTTG